MNFDNSFYSCQGPAPFCQIYAKLELPKKSGLTECILYVREGNFRTCTLSTLVTAILLYEKFWLFACLISFLTGKLGWLKIEISTVVNLDFLLRKWYKF